jgi:hypothetical protein
MNNTNRTITYLYFITLFFITLSGFAQMPIFSRYYIADIPGLGWLGDFYINHKIHYIFATVFLGLVTYTMVDFFMDKKSSGKITRTGYTKAGIIAGLIITGSLMMVKNFTGTPFPNGVIIFLDISHLVFCMGLLFLTAMEVVRNSLPRH